jgi:transposase
MKSVREFKGVFIHKAPVDMRKSINGLSAIVELEGMGELMGPHLFVFANRRRNLMKILYFDKSGFAVWMRKLEKDKFPWPRKATDDVVQITSEKLAWLLDGYDIWKLKPFEELYFDRVI